MTAAPLRTGNRPLKEGVTRGLLPMAVVALALLLGSGTSRAEDAPPTSEEAARYLEWYKRQGAARIVTEQEVRLQEARQHNALARPMPLPAAELPNADATSRFVEWYQHEGAPKASAKGEEIAPTSSDVASFLEWYRRNGAPTPSGAPPALTREAVACFVDAYRRSCAPVARPATGLDGKMSMPSITSLEVQSIYDNEVRQASSQEQSPPLLITAPPLEPPTVEHVTANGAKTAPATPPVAAVVAFVPPSVDPIPNNWPSASVPPAPPPPETPNDTPLNTLLQQVGCTSCGQAGGTLPPHSAMNSGASPAIGAGCNCGSGNCVPGRAGCTPCEANTVVGRFLCGVYECICCPDPCYEPKWIPIADAAFFVDSARPQTQQRIGYDAGRNLIAPDRAEFFWARADGKGQGPNPANHYNPAGLRGESSVNYNDLYLYTEAALGNIGTFVYMPYRSLDGEVVGHAANFGDMQVGTKTLLFDCELLQIALEFRTYIPIGNATKGLGTGHVSLEPSLIVGLKVGPDTYFQGQVAEWIPLGGDNDYQGAILHYHASLNQVLYRILPDVPLIGTAEFNGWSFQDGAFTDLYLGPNQRASGGTYVSMGPGLRLFICDKIDIGIGAAFAVTDRHFADQLYRTELRWRF